MVTGPDDLTSWRPDDGSEEEAIEMHVLIRESMAVFGKYRNELAIAVEKGMSWVEYEALPRPRRDMLLQRRQVPQKAR